MSLAKATLWVKAQHEGALPPPCIVRTQMVKNLPAMQETHVQPLGQEDPLEKETATHASIVAWKIPW